MDVEERKMGRKEKRLYDLKDYIKKQKMEIFKTRNQLNDNAMAEFMEEELKSSIEEVEALEAELKGVGVQGEATMGTPIRTPIRSNRRFTL